jgi:hypothetical protein
VLPGIYYNRKSRLSEALHARALCVRFYRNDERTVTAPRAMRDNDKKRMRRICIRTVVDRRLATLTHDE